MLTQKAFIDKIFQETHHIIDMPNSEILHSAENQQGDNIFTSYYYLYFNYDYNYMVHYKEVTEGVLDISGDVVDERTLGYEILKFYRFR